MKADRTEGTHARRAVKDAGHDFRRGVRQGARGFGVAATPMIGIEAGRAAGEATRPAMRCDLARISHTE